MANETPLMELVKIATAIIAAVISVISFFIARMSNRRSKKAEDIKTLLGDKENVAFGALKLLRDRLPKSKKDRELVISALLQACLLEGSDRARALIYRVIDNNKDKYQKELQAGFNSLSENYNSMEKYKFTTEELDLSRARRRLAAIQKIIVL